MRFITGLAVFVALATAAIFFTLQQGVERKHENDVACRDESILLDVWRAQGVIDPLEQQGGDIIVKAGSRSWHKLTRAQQVGIGKAAFCAIKHSGRYGIVHLRFGDDEFAQVANDRWYSTRYPE